MASWVSSSSGYNRCKQFFSIVLIREIKDDDDDNDRKEILGSFVTKEKIIFNRRPKKKPHPSDQVKRQIKYQCWHVDKHTRPWGSLLSSHEGFTKLRHFWFQHQVRQLSVWTVIQLFMVSLTASKLRRQFWSSKRQRARASDFSSNLKTTASVTVYSYNSCKIHWGFLYTKMHGVHIFNKFWISSSDISLRTVHMVPL